MGIQRPITTPSSCNLVAISSIHNRLINHANMPAVRHPCSPLVKGHPCGEELLPSVYQAALSHAGSYVRRASSQHTPWEAVTFVAISAIVLVAYMAILGYLATRALRQVPRSSNALTGLLDTRLGYNLKTDKYQPPVPTDATDSPEGSVQV